jgi:hypothetical protein
VLRPKTAALISLIVILTFSGSPETSVWSAMAHGARQLDSQQDIVDHLMNSEFPQVSALEGCEEVEVGVREGLADDPSAKAVDVACLNSPFESAGIVFFVFQTDEQAEAFATSHSATTEALFEMTSEIRQSDGLEYLMLYTLSLPVLETPQAIAFATKGKTVVMVSVSGDSNLRANRYFRFAEDLVTLAVEELGAKGDPIAKI